MSQRERETAYFRTMLHAVRVQYVILHIRHFFFRAYTEYETLREASHASRMFALG
jgi:hypothetical protein